MFGNVLNSLGVTSSTAQMRLEGWPVHRVAQVAAMLEENRGSLAEFLTHDERGKRVPEYLASLAARLESDLDAARQDFDAIGGHVQYLRQIIQAQQSFARMGGAHDEVEVGELLGDALTVKGQDLNGWKSPAISASLPIVCDHPAQKLLQIIVNFVAMRTTRSSRTARLPRVLVIVCSRRPGPARDRGRGFGGSRHSAGAVVARVWEFGFTTKTHGHGFGLHSAAVAAQQLGGTISAESDGIGQGRSFLGDDTDPFARAG